MRAKVLLLAIAITVATVSFVRLSTVAPEGAVIFEREFCVKCHTLRGHGMGVINITGVTERRSRAWIMDQLTDARLHSSRSGMPRFGHLSHAEKNALIKYLAGP